MNNYHIYEEIGKGKFSTVYKGRKKKSIEYVAVKSLEKSRKKKILNEVQIFRGHNLCHSNILHFHNWHETRNHLWVIFEYCAGGDLLHLIEQDKAVTQWSIEQFVQLLEPTIKNFAKDLVSGLLYLHSHGVVYCDLKPSNVLINEYGSLKLSDFGHARKIVDLISTNLDENGNKVGTPSYMAPELFQDDGVYSFATDLWSLGCVLHEMATGKPPFFSEEIKQLVHLITTAETPKVEKFSPEFNSLLGSLLEKDPSKRITWDRLRYHDFWGNYEFPTTSLPNQPHFESYLRAKGLVTPQPLGLLSLNNNREERPQTPIGEKPKTPTSMIKKNGLSAYDSNTSTSSIKGAVKKESSNLLRMSQNAIKNLIKENQGGYNKENKDSNVSKDIKLINKDQELNFGERNEDEDEDDDSELSDLKEDDNIPEEEVIETQVTPKIDYSSSTRSPQIKTELSVHKTPPSSNINVRKLKPEIDDMSVTPKNTRSNSALTEEQITTSNFLSHQRSQSALISTPSANTLNTNSVRGKPSPIEQLLSHATDCTVKPITGNKEIEKPIESIFNKELLPFKCYGPEDVLQGIDTPLIETHLVEIHNFLGSPNPSIAEKLNVLNYFETIIQTANVANRLVNSNYVALLLKLTKVKNSQFKMKVCSILSELIRHATVIDQKLSEAGLPAHMQEVLKDTNEKAKRKAIAALGEYLFYGATQMDEDPNNVVWDISSTTVSFLKQILKANEDETVKFYVCKTIENITAQSHKAAAKFANQDFSGSLLQIYATTKNENLRICAATALNHICRLNNTLCWGVIEKLSFHHLCATFADGHQKIQQAFISIVNQFLFTAGSKAYSLLADERSFILSLINLLDNSHYVIRGKAILSFCLMFKISIKWMMVIGEHRFQILLDKVSKETQKYVQTCLSNLVEFIADMIPMIQKNILDELVKLRQRDDAILNDGSLSPKDYRNYVGLMPILFGMMNSGVLRQKIVNSAFLLNMFSIYDLSETIKKSVSDDFRSMVFMIFENFSTNQKLVLIHHEIVLQTFFPSLLGRIISENPDSRFNGLKLITDILIHYLNDDSVYDPTGTKMSNSTKIINDIIANILPSIKYILNDQDPMPLYGLKLFSIIIEKCPGFVAKLKQKKLHSLFLEYFTANHPRLTSNTLKIIIKIVESKDTTLEELYVSNFLGKTVSILKTFWTHCQEWCYDELLEILQIFFNKIQDTLKLNRFTIPNLDMTMNPTIITDNKALSIVMPYDSYLELLEVFISLSTHMDLTIADKALGCLMSTLYMFGKLKKRDILIRGEEASLLFNILAEPNKSVLWRKAAKALHWLIALQDYRLTVPVDKKFTFSSILDKHKNSEDKALSLCCKELKRYLAYQAQWLHMFLSKWLFVFTCQMKQSCQNNHKNGFTK